MTNPRSPLSGRGWGCGSHCRGSSLRTPRGLVESSVWLPGRCGGDAGCVVLPAELAKEMGLALCSWPDSEARAAGTRQPWSGVLEGEQSIGRGEIKRSTG